MPIKCVDWDVDRIIAFGFTFSYSKSHIIATKCYENDQIKHFGIQYKTESSRTFTLNITFATQMKWSLHLTMIDFPHIYFLLYDFPIIAYQLQVFKFKFQTQIIESYRHDFSDLKLGKCFNIDEPKHSITNLLTNPKMNKYLKY